MWTRIQRQTAIIPLGHLHPPYHKMSEVERKIIHLRWGRMCLHWLKRGRYVTSLAEMRKVCDFIGWYGMWWGSVGAIKYPIFHLNSFLTVCRYITFFLKCRPCGFVHLLDIIILNCHISFHFEKKNDCFVSYIFFYMNLRFLIWWSKEDFKKIIPYKYSFDLLLTVCQHSLIWMLQSCQRLWSFFFFSCSC